jgi:hypothetical protein
MRNFAGIWKLFRLLKNKKNPFFVFLQCSQRGSQDFVEMGGASDLDSAHLMTSETLCGYQTQPADKARRHLI